MFSFFKRKEKPSINSEENEKVRAHIFVSGKVQGVFFRENTRQKAEKLGVAGFVKNLKDGRVEAVLEGEREKVEKMIKWTKRGPMWAQVKDLEVSWEDYQGEFKEFEIKYDL